MKRPVFFYGRRLITMNTLHNVSMAISNPEVEAGDKTDGIEENVEEDVFFCLSLMSLWVFSVKTFDSLFKLHRKPLTEFSHHTNHGPQNLRPQCGAFYRDPKCPSYTCTVFRQRHILDP